MSEKKPELELDQDQIRIGTEKGLKKYEKLSFLEKYSMFMGIAQFLELGLKNLLVENHGYDLDKLDRKTLGQTKNELEKVKLRPDFLKLLDSVVEYRNYIAHEIIANRGLYISIVGDKVPEGHYDKKHRILDKAICELEQLVFLFQWTNENDAW
jgi:hypothetical protein